MTISDLRNATDQLIKVRFFESSCGPMVIELQTQKDRELLRDKSGDVISCKNITQAYSICRDAGIHTAELVQTIPHDEACASPTLSYEQQVIPLKF